MSPGAPEAAREYAGRHDDMDPQGKPVLGLIGGIGAGKSAVALLLARHGGRVIVADRLGHEALRQPAVRDRLVARWGPEVLGPDGEIDRRAVAARVFAPGPEGAADRRFLESLSHPHIERRLGEEIARARADEEVRFVVLDAAVLLEAGWDRACDRLVFVEASREARLRRVAVSRGWGAEELEGRERAQMSLEEKKARADAVVDNSGPADATRAEVEALLARWGLAGERRPERPARPTPL